MPGFVSRTQLASAGGSLDPQQVYDLLKSQGASDQEATYLTYASTTHEDPSGSPAVVNNDPATGDFSVGLFQVNYFGDLLASRTRQFGSPAQLAQDPVAQADAALEIYRSSGPGAWPTSYADLQAGKIKGFTPGAGGQPGPGGPGPTDPYGTASHGTSSGGGGSLWSGLFGGVESAAGDVLSTAEGAAQGVWGDTLGSLEGTVTSAVGFLKAAAWLIHPLTWLRLVEGTIGVGLVVGGVLVATGAAGKVVEGLEGAAGSAGLAAAAA